MERLVAKVAVHDRELLKGDGSEARGKRNRVGHRFNAVLAEEDSALRRVEHAHDGVAVFELQRLRVALLVELDPAGAVVETD